MGKKSHRSIRRRGVGRGLLAGVGALALASALPACENINESLGFGKRAPDEFAVFRSAPLTLPPDYQLRPPRPGEPRPSDLPTREQGKTVLLSESGSRPAREGAAATQGESAFLRRADAAEVDPDIRFIIDREFAGYASEDESFVESLLFWRSDDPPGDVVDPVGEAQRLRDNAARGASATEGETPTIKRREKALLEGFFN